MRGRGWGNILWNLVGWLPHVRSLHGLQTRKAYYLLLWQRDKDPLPLWKAHRRLWPQDLLVPLVKLPYPRVPLVSWSRHGHGMGDLPSHPSLSFAALTNIITAGCFSRPQEIALWLQKTFLVYTEFGWSEMVTFKVLIEVFKAYAPYISQNYHCTYQIA